MKKLTLKERKQVKEFAKKLVESKPPLNERVSMKNFLKIDRSINKKLLIPFQQASADLMKNMFKQYQEQIDSGDLDSQDIYDYIEQTLDDVATKHQFHK